MATSMKLSFPESDVAVLTLDMPGKGANILSRSILEELSVNIDRLEEHSDLQGLVIVSAKPGIFIAGADLREFAMSLDAPEEAIVEKCQLGQKLFQRLRRSAFCDDRGHRWDLRGRRRRACDVVRSPDHERRSENGDWLSRSQAWLVSWLGRYCSDTAHDRITECGRVSYRGRFHQCRRGVCVGMGQQYRAGGSAAGFRNSPCAG